MIGLTDVASVGTFLLEIFKTIKGSRDQQPSKRLDPHILAETRVSILRLADLSESLAIAFEGDDVDLAERVSLDFTEQLSDLLGDLSLVDMALLDVFKPAIMSEIQLAGYADAAVVRYVAIVKGEPHLITPPPWAPPSELDELATRAERVSPYTVESSLHASLRSIRSRKDAASSLHGLNAILRKCADDIAHFIRDNWLIKDIRKSDG